MSLPPAYAMPSPSAQPQPQPNSSPALNHSVVAGTILTSLPTRSSSRSTKAYPGNGAVAGTDSGMRSYQSPLNGLPPLLVPPSSAHSSSSSTTPSTSSHFPTSPSVSNRRDLTSSSSAGSAGSPLLLRADDTNQPGMKHYNSPVPGLPPLMMPAVAVQAQEREHDRGSRPSKLQEKGLGEITPIIANFPPSPSLDMAYFSGSGTTHEDEDDDGPLTPSQSHSHSSVGGKTSTDSSQTHASIASYASNHSSAPRSGNSKVSAAPPPPPENHPLPPIPSAGGRGTASSHLAHPTNGTGPAGVAGSHIVRSPSPLSPFSGHGEIQPYQSSPSSSSTQAQLQGLGLGPVHRSRNGEGALRSVSTPTPSLSTPGSGSTPNPSRIRQQPPRVQVIASSSSTSGGPSRAIHRDLPPIVTAPAAPDYSHRPAAGSQLPSRSVSLSSPRQPHPYPASSNSSVNATPSRKLPIPPALDLKQSPNNYRQMHPTQMLSPGMGMGLVSPGFSPTNVVVDSLIEEMHDDEEKDKDRSPANTAEGEAGPVRKTSVLNRPRPRASSRSSSYRADPISRTPTPQQTTFNPNVHDSTTMFATQPQDITNPYYRPSIKLTDVFMHEGVQKALLPFLSIASFLSLLTAFDKRWRRCISGEMVGKWIVREWALNLGPDVAWPGLGVWEGFLESLLHNSEAYPTYPTHLTSLLRHLSLSHTLIVLFLRSLPPTAFPTMPPFPFEDEPSISSLSHSVSNLSLFGGAGQRSRTASAAAGSEYGGSGPSRQPQLIPKAERVVELVMPEPLSAVKSDLGSQELLSSPSFSNGMTNRQHKRRSSVGSASIISWRNKDRRGSESSAAGEAFVMPRREGKKHSAPPPVSFPTAKRYVFKGFGDPVFTHSRKRNSLDGGGTGSIFSVDESAAGRSLYGDSSGGSTFPSRHGQMRTRPFGDLFGKSSMGGHYSPSSNSLARFAGSMPDDRTATSSPTFGRIRPPTPQPVEPAFQKPIPYVVGRAPILRVFVPLSQQVPDWPCAEGARRARHELERCGAWSKLRLGDVVVNTALRDPLSSRHLMLFVPTVQPYLVPLEYRFSPEGHLPGYFDAFKVPPSYYYPLLPAPYIVSPDLSPWADNAVATIRLAFERSDIATSRGEKIVAKRYLHVCGFEITPNAGHLACDEWQGMVTLEAEGTAEGRASLLRRLGRAANESRTHAQRGPWEIIPEKSLGGTVWLRLISDKPAALSPT